MYRVSPGFTEFRRDEREMDILRSANIFLFGRLDRMEKRMVFCCLSSQISPFSKVTNGVVCAIKSVPSCGILQLLCDPWQLSSLSSKIIFHRDVLVRRIGIEIVHSKWVCLKSDPLVILHRKIG